MKYVEIFEQVAKDLNIPLNEVVKAYKSYWQFIRETIKPLPLKGDLTEEEFSKLRTNFNIPSLGKMYCTYEGIMNMKKYFEHLKNLRDAKNQEDTANVYSIDNNRR